MKIRNMGRALSSCKQIPLGCLAPGVVYSVASCPFSLFVKLKNNTVIDLSNFDIVFGFQTCTDTMVIPHPEVEISALIGEYDSNYPDNKYYKTGTEPLPCK